MTPRPRTAVLVNPASLTGSSAKNAEVALRHLARTGWDATLVSGSDPADALERTRDHLAAGTDVLTVVGGDGLVHLGLQAVAGSGVPLAVVPAGTGNDFARALGIPRRDPAAAARLITEGTRRAVDLARCGDRWFGTVLASGFDALVTRRANALRRPRGGARYTVATFVELARLRPLPFRLRLDDRELALDATLVAVGNTCYYGSGMKVCPDAVPDDGELAVTVVESAPAVRLMTTLPRFYSGSHVSHPKVRTYRARHVELAAPDVFAYADGEFISDLPLTVDCVPGAVSVLVPE
ncbi:diacylglycerol kinase [Streptomyces diacarni]|uniref:diacylglycerol kinase n=1 Tax=Streptomyces diacarni TaxID=2800381 RepID=UPI0033C1BDA2